MQPDSLVTTLLPAIALIAIVALFLYFRRKPSNPSSTDDYQKIVENLQFIVTAADHRRTQLYQSLDETEDRLVYEIVANKAALPDFIRNEVDAIEELWNKLTEQLEKYAEHPAVDTLESSALTNQAAAIAKDIEELVKTAQAKLKGRL